MAKHFVKLGVPIAVVTASGASSVNARKLLSSKQLREQRQVLRLRLRRRRQRRPAPGQPPTGQRLASPAPALAMAKTIAAKLS